MTTHKTLKRRVRARMDNTGERYTAARRNVLAEPATPESPAAGGPPPVSDDAVRKGTGRGWDEWFAILDAAGAVAWKHPDIARWVAADYGISGWWAQSVTVGFERARGLRAQHERPTGYSLSATKTVNVPVERLHAALANADERKAWLEHTVRISSGTPPRTATSRGATARGSPFGSKRAVRPNHRWRSNRIRLPMPQRSRSCGRSGEAG